MIRYFYHIVEIDYHIFLFVCYKAGVEDVLYLLFVNTLFCNIMRVQSKGNLRGLIQPTCKSQLLLFR